MGKVFGVFSGVCVCVGGGGGGGGGGAFNRKNDVDAMNPQWLPAYVKSIAVCEGFAWTVDSLKIPKINITNLSNFTIHDV